MDISRHIRPSAEPSRPTNSFRRSPLWILAAVAVIALLNSSCNTSGCTDNQNSLPLAGFYSYETGQKVTLGSVEVGGVGAPDDSLLYTAGQALSQIYMPLRANASSTSYYFHYTQEGLDSVIFNDTITFAYSSTPFFASEECGALFHYDIQRMTYTRHLIDSVALVDSLITNTDLERIRIYFRTAQEGEL